MINQHLLSYQTGILNAGRFLRNRLLLAGAVQVLLLVALAVLAPVMAPHNPLQQQIGRPFLPPSGQYPLGTDELGRCVLSRLLHGAGLSLQLALAVVLTTGLAGTFIGLVSGYLEGMADEVIMRVVDIYLAFPGLILAIVIAGLLGPGPSSTMLALSVVGWTRYARLARGITMTVKRRAFVEAARSLGGSHAHIIITHILPELVSPVIVMSTLGMGWTIVMVASLSFLGLGVQPPTPEWGAMLNSGRNFLRVAPQLSIFPGLAIMITVLAFTLFGDGLRDALDPKFKDQ